MTLGADDRELLERLRAVLDAHAAQYKELSGAANFSQYLDEPPDRDDEELLTEPILQGLVERVLDFPTGGYFRQFGRSGLKPDLTPMDMIAHPFVFDAKSSLQKLPPHEAQIRKYMDQRALDYGVLFNLRELRVYRRGVGRRSLQGPSSWPSASSPPFSPQPSYRTYGFPVTCRFFSSAPTRYGARSIPCCKRAAPWSRSRNAWSAVSSTSRRTSRTRL